MARQACPERSRRAHYERRKCSTLAVRPELVEGCGYDVFQTESAYYYFVTRHMSPTKRLKCHSEPKRSGGEESKILRRCAPQDNSIIELVAGSNKVVLRRCDEGFLLLEIVQTKPLPIAKAGSWV